jgi:hypothetical protein
MSNSGSQSNYYGLILVLSIIGFILFAFTDFGGYVGGIYNYRYSVSLESSFNNPDLIAYAPLFILVIFLFLLNVFLPLKELNFIKASFPSNSAKLGFYSSLGILVISAVGAVAFEAILSESGATDWWFDAGFYAGIIGGILLPLLYYFIMKNSK